MNERLLGIGDFARHTRLSIKALRHYDDHGLLTPAHVDPVTRYRYYAPDQRSRATLIGDLRRIDVPLAVVARILDASPDDALAVYQEWWITQERRHADRRGIGRYVIARLRREGHAPMDIHTRTVPARKLAVISRELFQPELDEFIVSAFATLFAWAERHPGLRSLDTTPEDPTYVIFHGPVSPDASAVVEVCAVIDGPAEPEGDIVLRREDEHAEAYVPATKEGIGYPAILAAYDAVAAWVSEHGEMIRSMPSREVYVADVVAAAADDVVCEITFPYRPAQ